jgi:hypothetical protein
LARWRIVVWEPFGRIGEAPACRLAEEPVSKIFNNILTIQDLKKIIFSKFKQSNFTFLQSSFGTCLGTFLHSCLGTFLH